MPQQTCVSTVHDRCACPTAVSRYRHRPGGEQDDRPEAKEIETFLDDACDRLLHREADQAAVRCALDDLIVTLQNRKVSASESEWRTIVSACRSHRLLQVVHQDPFTYHAYSKPRGYPGDAALLDLIYGYEEGWPHPNASHLGQLLFNCTVVSPASEGVRARRGLVADLLDRLAEADLPAAFLCNMAQGLGLVVFLLPMCIHEVFSNKFTSWR